MRTYDAWFPRYALGNGLMFFCRVFSPVVGRGSSALSTFLDRRTQRVNLDFKATTEKQHINKAKLHYKSSSDSAKMAVYVSSS